ncbi:hypothetical protein F511_17999 [Dorcoceras hygrometricum]|uniref:Uncharacterized protein n=1 Tax=Dorcoceras hygrometricum TaxID=472368 RepID=A0A2Z7DH13_9LAMI|nr:hypothetical protein F511_17999 [Dorcoceras hygrometricum]
MSLFDLQDICIAIGSIATLDLPMVVDLIGIYGLKGPYCTLTMTNWFLQALSVIPRGSWGDVARRSYHDPLGKSGIVIPEPQWLWAHGWLIVHRIDRLPAHVFMYFLFFRCLAGGRDPDPQQTAIHFGFKINWSKILFEVLKEMVDRSIKRSKGFAAQICVLLKRDPAVSLGEAKTFPPLKILSAKTVNTYVATNKTIDAHGESDEPHVDKVAILKRKSVSKKKSAPTDKKDADEELVEVVAEKAVSKKRSAATDTGRDRFFRAYYTDRDRLNSCRSYLQIPASDVNFSSPHVSSESRMHFDSTDIPLGDDTADDQSSMPPVTDFIEAFAQLHSSINHMQFEQIRQKDDWEHLKDMILTKIRSLEKKLTKMLEKQDRFYRGLFKTVRQEIQIQNTSLSLELFEFKKGVGAQNAFLISDVTDIHSHTKEIQALKTDFTNFQQRSEEGIAHVSDQLSEIIAYINRGGNDKKGESSSHGPKPPPDDRDRSGSGGNGGRSRGGRSESSKRRYDSSGGPRKRSAEYWFGGK